MIFSLIFIGMKLKLYLHFCCGACAADGDKTPLCSMLPEGNCTCRHVEIIKVDSKIGDPELLSMPTLKIPIQQGFHFCCKTCAVAHVQTLLCDGSNACACRRVKAIMPDNNIIPLNDILHLEAENLMMTGVSSHVTICCTRKRKIY